MPTNLYGAGRQLRPAHAPCASGTHPTFPRSEATGRRCENETARNTTRFSAQNTCRVETSVQLVVFFAALLSQTAPDVHSDHRLERAGRRVSGVADGDDTRSRASRFICDMGGRVRRAPGSDNGLRRNGAQRFCTCVQYRRFMRTTDDRRSRPCGRPNGVAPCNRPSGRLPSSVSSRRATAPPRRAGRHTRRRSRPFGCRVVAPCSLAAPESRFRRQPANGGCRTATPAASTI